MSLHIPNCLPSPLPSSSLPTLVLGVPSVNCCPLHLPWVWWVHQVGPPPPSPPQQRSSLPIPWASTLGSLQTVVDDAKVTISKCVFLQPTVSCVVEPVGVLLDVAVQSGPVTVLSLRMDRRASSVRWMAPQKASVWTPAHRKNFAPVGKTFSTSMITIVIIIIITIIVL